jgi:cell division protein FtsW (lipid II flippase)
VNFIARFRQLDCLILIASSLLVAIGLLAIARAEQLAGTDGRLFRQQMVFGVLALIVLWCVTLPSYRVMGRWSYVILALAVVLLIAVYFFPKINGAHRWIRLGPVGLQPSELAKIAFVLALARWLMYRDNYRRLRGLFVPLVLAFIPVVLILREPDLGTALVFLPVLFVMLFAAGARGRDLAVVGFAGVLMLPMLWSQMSREQKSRVTAVFSQTELGQRPGDDHFHLHRAKQMLAMGGNWGTWLSGTGESYPRRFLVPAAATDSILCVIAERFGLLGVSLTLFLYTVVVWRCLAIARSTQEPFGRMVVVGIASLIGVQALINVGMMVGLLPITGLSLPLVSYGGSGMLAVALALGIVLNVGMRPGYELAGEPFRFATRRKAA